MAKISKIVPKTPLIPKRKRVAAYARVSMECDKLAHSLSVQISRYSELIQKNPEWEYAGVYADSFVSGTSTDKREEFKRMLEDCEQGKIDIILTKSISRFARNTVDLLETVRRLKELGIEVRFEKERINSMSGDGELMLSILASFAQEESRSISENVKWGTRKRYEQGIPNGRFRIYGYRWEGDRLVIEPEEAKIVRLIYDNFLNGISAETTEKELENMGVKSLNGQRFSNSSIRAILRNEKYAGNMLLQKDYTPAIAKHSKRNNGVLPRYYVEKSHEPIIAPDIWQKVQDEIARRKRLGAAANPHIPTSCFTSKLKCSKCGRSYRQHSYKRQDGSARTWCCRSKDEKGVKVCNAENVPHPALIEACRAVLGTAEFDEELFLERVDGITVMPGHTLIFHMTDGEEIPYTWRYKSTARADCWTDERRREWGKQHMGNNNNPNKNPFTGMLRCPVCGGNFRRQAKTYADGTDSTYWHYGHDSVCENKCKVPESLLKSMICEVLGLEDFDEIQFKERVSYIEFTGDTERKAVFFLKDGSSAIREWVKPKKRGVKHTEEFKQHMSKVMKARWDEKNADSN